MEPQNAALMLVNELYPKVGARLPLDEHGQKTVISARVAIGYYSLGAVSFHMSSKLLYEAQRDELYWFNFVAVIGKIFGEWTDTYSLSEIMASPFEKDMFSRFLITYFPVENTKAGIDEFLGRKRRLREIFAILVHFRLFSYQSVPTKHAEVSGQLAEKDIFLIHLWILGGSRIHDEGLEVIDEIMGEIYSAVHATIMKENGA